MKVKTYFSTIAFLIFSHLQNFLKIGIYTHPIDLSCHQKLEKNSPTGSGNIGARSWKMRKNSRSTRFHFTHARSCSRAQSTPHARETSGLPAGHILILCGKEIFVSVRSFYGFAEK